MANPEASADATQGTVADCYQVVLTYDLPSEGSVPLRNQLASALVDLGFSHYKPTAFVHDNIGLVDVWNALDLVARVINTLGGLGNLTLQVQCKNAAGTAGNSSCAQAIRNDKNVKPAFTWL